MLRRLISQYSIRNFTTSGVWKDVAKSKLPEKNSSTSTVTQEMNTTVAPGEWHKTILVFSGKYKSKQEVPSRISLDVLNRARSKVRIKVGNIMMVAILLGCIYFAYLGKKKAQKGETIHQQLMKRHDELRADYLTSLQEKKD